MKNEIAAVLSFALAIVPVLAVADRTGPVAIMVAQGAASSAAMSAGEIKKIDKDAGKITIKHGPLTNLGMPAMTMVFRVKDPAMLGQVKVGDKIRFVASRQNGSITIVQLEREK